MSIKKLLLLSCMALAAAAFAAPAGASASGMFYHEGQPLGAGPNHLTLEGPIGFRTPEVAGFECNAETTIELETFSASLVNLDIHTEECNGEGLLAGCELVNDEQTSSFDWFITPTATDIDITEGLAIWNEFDPGCPIHELEVTSDPNAPVTITPDDHTAFSSGVISGSVIVDIPEFGLELPAEAFGGGVVTDHPGTYGLTAEL